MNHHTVAGRAYKVGCHCACQVPSFLPPAFKSFNLPFSACCTAPNPHVLASEAHQTQHIIGEGVADDTMTASRAENDVSVTSSSSNAIVEKMANKVTPMMSDYWKKSTVIEADRSTYHTTDWLGGALESFILKVDIPMVDNTTIVCFESHPISRLGLPPSKFLVSIMNFLRCKLVHLNLNAIAALSCFTMLCECWLEIAPDTSLSWYFYSPAQ
jgi:hypothetical protein